MIYIDNQADFELVTNRIEKSKIIAIDTEFIRDNTYIPKLCLIQIFFDDNIYIIDPLSLKLDSFIRILTDKKIIKVMHGAVQDLDLFYKNYNITLENIFDCQIAASFLGYGQAISYAKIVKNILGLNIKKDQKLTDWAIRPLSKSQIEYAALDVKYLIEIYKRLYSKLEELGRLVWVEEEFLKLVDKKNYLLLKQDSWKKIKANSNKPFFYNYLKAFSDYREKLALKENKPKKFIFKDDLLVRLAQMQPQNIEDLKKDRLLSKMIKSENLIDIIETSKNVFHNKMEELSKENYHLSSAQELQSDIIKLYLKLVAKDSMIAAANIANSDDIKSYLKGDNMDILFLKGWRYEIFGTNLKKILAGELKFFIEDGKLVCK